MSEYWNLDDLYLSFEDEHFLQDIENLKKEIEEFNELAKKINTLSKVEGLESYLQHLATLTTLSYRLEAFISLTQSVDTTNKEALRYDDILNQLLTKTVIAQVTIEKWIGELNDIETYAKQSSLIQTHSYILNEIIKMNQYRLSENEENIIANMKNTGSNAWLKLKDQLIANHKVSIDGQEYPLTMVLNMAYDSDKEVRKKAYEAEIASYSKIEQGVAACLNAIKGEVLTECQLRGYHSVLEHTLIHSRMSQETLNSMLQAMEEYLPVFRKYLKAKAKALGYQNGLPFYELYAPINQADMKFDYSSGAEFVIKQFNTFSSHLASFASKAIQQNWIDVYPRANKVGGAFCLNLPFIKQSRFLLNYGNTFSDVTTLSHELGHGFHGECLKNESILNTDYPMPIAETASTFSETIIKKAAIKQASQEEALAILEAEISDCTQVIVDIYSRYLFEKNLFKERKTSALSVERIKTLMIESQKAAYGDGLDPDYLHPYMWTWKPHYYSASSNFYNFPYAFGLLLAKGLYAIYLKEGKEFALKYEQFLSMTGKNDLETITKSIGIDITKPEFWRNSLKIIEEDIQNFIRLLEKN
ncbi:MAG: M3 family oligoendopeptidase [Erysipelotrichaceae bacterium]|nr:M3 family oligoendopeptidase [Erysipelotrichaceae bacterium]